MQGVTRIVGAAAVAAAVALAAGSAQARQEPDRSEIEDWKPEKLVNIQVLPKDITPDELMATMRSWNEVLNVDCVFCHKGQIGKPWSTFDFTDDSKTRHQSARLMVRTTDQLNQDFADLGDPAEPTKVTCATCHRRSRHPEITLPAEEGEKGNAH